uniref:Predicted gene 9903 n=1 Tax=Mus spicilegus TaxID=10103 RepID=A0A8C6HPR2_MUSSI
MPSFPCPLLVMCLWAGPFPLGVSFLDLPCDWKALLCIGYRCCEGKLLCRFLEDRGLATWITAGRSQIRTETSGRHLCLRGTLPRTVLNHSLPGQIWTYGGLLKSPRSPCVSQALQLIKLHTPHSSAVFE